MPTTVTINDRTPAPPACELPAQLPSFSPETHNVTAYTALLKDAYAKTDAAEKLSFDGRRAGDKRTADFYSKAAKHEYDRVDAVRSLITTVRATNIDEAAVHSAVLFGMFDCIMDQVPSEAETASFKREKAAIERLIFSLMDFLESQSTRPLSEQVNDYFGSPWCNPWQVTCPALIEEAAKLSADMVAELAKRFDEAWTAEKAVQHLLDTAQTPEDEEPWEAANLATQHVVQEIEEMEATTLDGLFLKARALQWCYTDREIDLRCDQDTTDLRLANSIAAALLRMDRKEVA